MSKPTIHDILARHEDAMRSARPLAARLLAHGDLTYNWTEERKADSLEALAQLIAQYCGSDWGRVESVGLPHNGLGIMPHQPTDPHYHTLDAMLFRWFGEDEPTDNPNASPLEHALYGFFYR